MSMHNEQIMEEAINKASSLIQLLTNENYELKLQIERKQQLLMVVKKNNSSAIESNEELKIKLKQSQEGKQQIKKQIEAASEKIRQLQEKVKEKIMQNKNLHQKISNITSKNIQLTKTIDKYKIDILSLQNQNDYLLKIVNKYQQKQNGFNNYCHYTQIQFKKEIFAKQRTKQAFSRRCDQLNHQNTLLKRQILALQQKNIIRKSNITPINTISTICERKDLIEQEKLASEIIEVHLQTKPRQNLKLKIQQLGSFLGYRLKHIESLIRSILQMVKQPQSQSNTDGRLENILILSERLTHYLNSVLLNK